MIYLVFTHDVVRIVKTVSSLLLSCLLPISRLFLDYFKTLSKNYPRKSQDYSLNRHLGVQFMLRRVMELIQSCQVGFSRCRNNIWVRTYPIHNPTTF